LVQWFWRRRFLNDTTPFLHFCDYLPFEKDLALYLNKLKFHLLKDDFTKLDSIWPAGFGEEDVLNFLCVLLYPLGYHLKTKDYLPQA
jgi:hypothetical protein